VAAAAVRGNHDERNTGSLTEEIERLDVARVIVAAAFIHGDEDRGALPEFLVALGWWSARVTERFLYR